MIVLRRSEERHHDRHRQRDVWLTFYPDDQVDSIVHGFGNLMLVNEERLAPGADVPHHPRHAAEIINYVREGALAYEDSTGHSGIVQSGEFQSVTMDRGVRHRETNASQTDEAQVFRIWLRPLEAGLAPGCEQKRFSAAERRDRLCPVASPNVEGGSLRIHQDALIYSALLDRGQHVVHELLALRCAWLHLVCGKATIGDFVLTTGDGVGVTAERSVSLTAHEKTEILLVDLGPSSSVGRSDHGP